MYMRIIFKNKKCDYWIVVPTIICTYSAFNMINLQSILHSTYQYRIRRHSALHNTTVHVPYTQGPLSKLDFELGVDAGVAVCAAGDHLGIPAVRRARHIIRPAERGRGGGREKH